MTRDVDGESIRQRRVALGLTARELAERAGVDRSRVAAVESGGNVRASTLGALDAALTRIEQELSGPYDQDADQITSTLELPDGTRVTFAGSAETVVDAVRRFQASRRRD